jgi:uncharacterized protein YehS (DUF1456 family)
MINNDTLRRLRYTFDFSDSKMVGILKLGGLSVTRAQVSGWLKKEEDEGFIELDDRTFSSFLNGLIIDYRGARGDSPPEPDSYMTNNRVLMKLKIALNLTSEDFLEIMELAGFGISKHELSAFFRKEGHKHYRQCLDQVLRNFLNGLKLKYHDKAAPKSKNKDNSNSALIPRKVEKKPKGEKKKFVWPQTSAKKK